jgi:hypothetical protein
MQVRIGEPPFRLGLQIGSAIQFVPYREPDGYIDAFVDLAEALLGSIDPSGNAIDKFREPLEIAAGSCGFGAEIAQSLCTVTIVLTPSLMLLSSVVACPDTEDL